jgi:uncharacterized protein (DUF1697 family)
MSSVVFLRGVNVGGHKAFRPSALVRELTALSVVSVGAAGTFVVRTPASPAEVRARFQKALPFEAVVMVSAARELTELMEADPFSGSPAGLAEGHFISVLEARPRRLPTLPIRAPAGRDWQVSIDAVHGRFVVSVQRRIGRANLYPNEVVEKQLGISATTRGWATILKVHAALEADPDRLARHPKPIVVRRVAGRRA